MSNSSILSTLNRAMKKTLINQFKIDESTLESLGDLIKKSDRPDIAPFQSNCSFKLSRELKLNPYELSSDIAEALNKNTYFQHVEAAKPGFINISPSSILIAGRALELSKDEERSGVTVADNVQKIILDYGGPNIAKPMHVGHLRSAIIGESLRRISSFCGHDVISDVHLGDWGFQMGLLICEIEDREIAKSYFDKDLDSFEEDLEITIDDLAEMYPKAASKAANDERFKERARVATFELQSGRSGYLALLQHFKKVTIRELIGQYENLGVHFDLWNGESDVNSLIDDIVEQYKSKKIAIKDDGAWIVDVSKPDDKSEIAPLILQSSTGSALYSTTDLATLWHRKEKVDPDLILYVVDNRQSLHFKQVFRAAEKIGWFKLNQLEHLGFGTVNGDDGKPFKTREGGVMELAQLMNLINNAAEKAYDKIRLKRSFETTNFVERNQIADIVGKAAVKFADLQNPRQSNYIFDIEKFVSFEGKTGPYIQYQGVRAKRVLEKADAKELVASTVYPFEDVEQSLILMLDSFNDVVWETFNNRAPHILCDHMYNIAAEFSKFYKFCPVLADDVDHNIRLSRLSIYTAFLSQLNIGLNLLGIRLPDKM